MQDTLERCSRAILSGTVERLGGIEVTQKPDFLTTFFVLNGVPYGLAVAPCTISTPYVYEIIGLDTRRVLFDEKQDSILRRINNAFAEALNEYVDKVRDARNEESLPEALKNHLLMRLRVTTRKDTP